METVSDLSGYPEQYRPVIQQLAKEDVWIFITTNPVHPSIALIGYQAERDGELEVDTAPAWMVFKALGVSAGNLASIFNDYGKGSPPQNRESSPYLTLGAFSVRSDEKWQGLVALTGKAIHVALQRGANEIVSRATYHPDGSIEIIDQYA